MACSSPLHNFKAGTSLLSCSFQDLIPNLDDKVVNFSVFAGLCTECVSLEQK